MLYVLKNNYLKIIGLITLSVLIDHLFIQAIDHPPAWDQGYHLSNVFKMYNIFDDNKLDLLNKFKKLIDVTDSYRGPLTYFLSAVFLKIFNNSYEYAYLSNQIFNVICIFSIYKISELLKNSSTGFWASLIFSFSSLIVNQRSDYLIDLSLTSFITLSLLFFTKWYLDKNENNNYAILSGASLGLVFLVKPTGIIFFTLPFLTILFKRFWNRKNPLRNINQILIFVFSFSLIIFPWFSKHWLTIITSTINAWKWGINYQEGFEINSLQGWIFYFKFFPSILGIFTASIFSLVYVFEKISQKNLLNFDNLKPKKINLWFLIFFLNCYLIVSLMSTKDIRFIMPIYPLFCIYFSLFINSKNYKYFSDKIKKFILIISIFLSLFLSTKELTSNPVTYDWPHFQIIKEIKSKTPYLTTTLAILPDTKEINTFNLEAEATRQGEYVAVRQIISNKDTYKEDLKYFDWFLVKTGNQGIMSNESKNLLNQYLLDNSSFVINNEWNLNDKSKLILLRRKTLNTSLSTIQCASNPLKINIGQINNGINISFFGKGKSLYSSNLLLDLIGKDFKKSINFSLANGFFHKKFDEENCYLLSQDIPINFPKNISKNLSIQARLLTQEGEIKTLKKVTRELNIKDELIGTEFIHMTNRISKVEELGKFLRKGQFKNIFDLVGIINQSDPHQGYLKNAEKIYFQRYKDNNKLEDLYSVLISQILQRKISQAEDTVNLILKSDFKNGNAHLTKAIINVYLFDKNDARLSLENANKNSKSVESSEILNTIDGLTLLLEMKFIKAYQTLA